MREYEPTPLSPFDRCIDNLYDYLSEHGRPFQYDAKRQSFRRMLNSTNCHALGRIVTVAVADATAERQPIMYDAMLFTEKGITASGLVARLVQDLPALDKTVQLDLTVDKMIYRTTLWADSLPPTQREPLGDEEVGMLAEQLDTLGSASRPW